MTFTLKIILLQLRLFLDISFAECKSYVKNFKGDLVKNLST